MNRYLWAGVKVVLLFVLLMVLWTMGFKLLNAPSNLLAFTGMGIVLCSILLVNWLFQKMF